MEKGGEEEEEPSEPESEGLVAPASVQSWGEPALQAGNPSATTPHPDPESPEPARSPTRAPGPATP